MRKRKRTESFGVDDYEPDTSKGVGMAGFSSTYGMDVIDKGLISDSEAREFKQLFHRMLSDPGHV